MVIDTELIKKRSPYSNIQLFDACYRVVKNGNYEEAVELYDYIEFRYFNEHCIKDIRSSYQYGILKKFILEQAFRSKI